jgi:chemotaxis protein CheC
MHLSEHRKDAFIELINIAYSRAAASLSEITGRRIILDVPRLDLYSTRDLPDALSKFLPGEVATVHQIFTGPVPGDAMLLLNHGGAVTLTDMLTENQSRPGSLNASGREALMEVGNILLNAYLGVFGNLLQVRISFSVPRLHIQSLESFLRSLIVDNQEMRYVLVVYTTFSVIDKEVEGYLLMAMSVPSLDLLLSEIGKWEDRQGSIESAELS